MLRIKFYEGKKQLFEITLRNCDYKDFKNHLVSFVYKDKRQFSVEVYEIPEVVSNVEHLVAKHIL